MGPTPQRLLLSIKAELENVTDFQPTEDFEYFFKVRILPRDPVVLYSHLTLL